MLGTDLLMRFLYSCSQSAKGQFQMIIGLEI